MTYMLLIIYTQQRCTLSVNGIFRKLDKGESVSLPVAGTGEQFITVFPENGRCIPYTAYLKLEEGEVAESSEQTVCWGDVTELFLRECETQTFFDAEPVLFGSAEFVINGEASSIELYRENGMKLALTGRNGERYYIPLGRAEGGKLGVIDVGSGRLLWIKLSGRTEKLCFMDGEGRLSEVITGDCVGVENGAAYSITGIKSIRGFERRTAYELTALGPKRMGEETGFFTHEGLLPECEPETALSFIEELELDFADWRDRLSTELRTECTREDLLGFFGNSESKAIYPLESPEGRAVIGLIRSREQVSRPCRFRFIFEEELITDIVEL